MAKELPEISMLRQLLSYDCDSGLVTWNDRPQLRSDGRPQGELKRVWGSPAGSALRSGHIVISINGSKYLAHRLGWGMHYGVRSFGEIDHINGDPGDNSIMNLREVTHAVNQRNIKRAKNSTSGYTGVCFHKQCQKWLAYITYKGKRISLGLHDTKEEAAARRASAQKTLGFGPSHGA